MKAIITITLLILLVLSCRKSGGGGTGPGSTPSTQDSENYVIIDGITYYHYTTGLPTVSCQGWLFAWTNNDPNLPNYRGSVTINNNQSGVFGVNSLINGVLTGYGLVLSNPIPTKVINGKTIIEFKDLKMYDVINDTTSASKLISGKFTCNGK